MKTIWRKKTYLDERAEFFYLLIFKSQSCLVLEAHGHVTRLEGKAHMTRFAGLQNCNLLTILPSRSRS